MKGSRVSIERCRCCTPLTRLYLILGETRSPLAAMLQQALCNLFSSYDIDAVALVSTLEYNDASLMAKCLERIARGALLASFSLGALLLDACGEADDDAKRLGSVDTIALREGVVSCRLLYPQALSKCLPRGYEALVAIRWRWQAKLLIAALAHAGYKRIHVTGERIDANIIGLDMLYQVDINIVLLETAHYYLDAVDVVIDTGVLRETRSEKMIRVSWEEPTSITPCLLSHWLTKAILLWESVFIDPHEAQAIVSSLFYSNHRGREDRL